MPQIIKNWDTSFALGGPIKRDKVWFFGVLRTLGNHNDVAGVYVNLNAVNLAAWNYVKDDAVKERLAEDKKIAGVRLTSQINFPEQGQRVLGLPEGVPGWRLPEGR